MPHIFPWPSLRASIDMQHFPFAPVPRLSGVAAAGPNAGLSPAEVAEGKTHAENVTGQPAPAVADGAEAAVEAAKAAAQRADGKS